MRSSAWHSRRASSPSGASPGAAWVAISMRGLYTRWSVLPTAVRRGLVAHDRDQVAHEQARVDQVQAPVGLDLAADHHVAGDVRRARRTGLAVHRDREVAGDFVLLA